MALLSRASAPLLVLGVLAACGADENGSPAGTWTTTITADDGAPSSRLVDDYRLELGTDGRYELAGAGFTASGTYVVDGHELELREDTNCAPGTTGRYAWERADDGTLVLTARGTDPCDQPLGGRQFVLTRHAWAGAG